MALWKNPLNYGAIYYRNHLSRVLHTVDVLEKICAPVQPVSIQFSQVSIQSSVFLLRCNQTSHIVIP